MLVMLVVSGYEVKGLRQQHPTANANALGGGGRAKNFRSIQSQTSTLDRRCQLRNHASSITSSKRGLVL